METTDFLILILLSFAAFRITRFFVKDSLIGFGSDSGSAMSVRVDNFAYYDNGDDRSWLRGKVGDLLTCVWCLGFWVSVGVYAGWTQTVPWNAERPGQWILTVFAIAGAQGYLNTRMNA